jgi:hypothetical protein
MEIFRRGEVADLQSDPLAPALRASATPVTPPPGGLGPPINNVSSTGSQLALACIFFADCLTVIFPYYDFHSQIADFHF